MDMNLSELQETVEDRGAGPAAAHGVTRVRYDLATEQEQQLYLLSIWKNVCKSLKYGGEHHCNLI